MSLFGKVLLFIFALITFGLGAWIIALPILAYLFLPPILRSRGKSAPRQAFSNGVPGRRSGMPVVKILGAVLLLLALIGIAEGGTFSPVVFGVPGVLLLAAPKAVSSLASSAKPVEDSILLRGSLLPFRWFAVARVYFSTRDPAGALSGLGERILFLSNPAELFIVFSTTALGRGTAERGILERMRSAAVTLSPLGVYLLPQEGKHAPEETSLRRRVKIPDGGFAHFLSSAHYDSILVEARNGVVEAVDVHDGAWGGSALNRPVSRPRSTVFLKEVLEAAFQRSGIPRPNEYTTFLSSMAATVGETLGQRIFESAVEDDDQAVAVSSLGTPKVFLSRVQLGAITSIYE